jgi:hypothetical protein
MLLPNKKIWCVHFFQVVLFFPVFLGLLTHQVCLVDPAI